MELLLAFARFIGLLTNKSCESNEPSNGNKSKMRKDIWRIWQETDNDKIFSFPCQPFKL